MEPRYWVEVVLAGTVATALGDVLKWLLWKLIAMVGEMGAPVGDVLWLLWTLIAMIWERVVLGWGHARALLNATPGVQTSESSAIAGAGTDVDDYTDSESDGIAIVAIGGEPSLEDHDGNN